MYSPYSYYRKLSSISLKPGHSTYSLSPLESLPVEIFELISEPLAFFDKKSLQMASKQTRHLMGPIQCPDPVSWIMHICWTARNSGVYDYTLINPHKIAGIVKGMSWRLGSTEFIHNIHGQAQIVRMGYRSQDIRYPYFPVQYILQSRENFIFGTLGVFMLYYIRAYLNRACVERQQRIERVYGSMEKLRYKDWRKVEA